MAAVIEDNQKQERETSLALRLGIQRFFYLQAIRAAVNFTTAAAADANLRQWRQWGARNLGGRTRALAQNPRNPSTIYAGSAQGGVFRSDDSADTWQPIGAPADAFPVGTLAIAPSNPNILYVGTGEAGVIHVPSPPPPGVAVGMAAFEAFAAGLGFFRYDATTGVFTNEVAPALAAPGTAGAANSYAAIAVDPRNADRCWIASHTGLWRREAGAVRFQSEVLAAPPLPPPPALGACVSDVILVENWNPDQPTTYRLYAAVAGTGIYRGVFTPNPVPATAWDPILAGGLPAPGALGAFPYDRIRVAACKSFPNHLYAVFENSADNSILSVFHSTDSGDNWAACAVPANLGTQAWADLCIAVHPDNPSIVAIGNVNAARTLNAGATWETIIDWGNFTSVDRAQHGDTHALMFDLLEPDRLWVGNDGGISCAPDVVNANPLTARTWRKRSHGLCISQFNDITSHPDYPFMLGGGLQDNGTYLTFGGPTWLPVGDADGGQMCFEVRNPRQYITPHQGDAASLLGNLMQSQVVAGSTVEPNPGFYPLVVRSSIPELPTPPNDIFSVQIALPAAVPGGVAGLFEPTLVHHPRQVNNLMAGGTGDLGFSTDGGANYAAGAVPGIAGDDVTALCYGPGATAAASDWWIGTSNGAVLRGDGGALAKVWTNVTPPLPAPGLGGIIITDVAVHPANNNYIVAATGGNSAAIAQGRVFLSNNRGANWMEVTGLAVASVIGGAPPGAVAGPLNALPPCPVTSLAFDPTVAAASPQILYVGTLAGVYVIRNLPRLPVGPPPPIVPPAAFNPDWRTFNGPAAAPLPITLVNDLEIVSLAPRPGAAANSPESTLRLRLYAAMYGRGIFVCDVSPNYPPGVPQGGPPRRLVIRQHLIEDGLAYPRPTPTVLNAAPAAPNYNQPQMQGDPRLLAIPSPVPAAPPIGAFNDHSALDIRVDNEPFQYFDETLDGVEFDEDLRTKNVVTGQVNAIYVQIHNAGWDRFTQPVDVHLFFAPGAAPAAGADPAPLPDLHDNFWSNFTVEPELPAPAGPLAPGAARWQRIGKKRTIPANRLSAAYPAVVRFEWTPPVSLAAAGFTGLLAVCTNPEDPLGAPAALPLVMRTLVRQERRAAFRLVAVNPYTPDVFIRDSVEDTGRATSGSFAGRSPDIIVVQSAEANPAAAFADLLDTHNGDRIRTGSAQIIYVRVFNRRNVQVQADVEVLWTQPNAATTAGDAHAPSFDGSKWTRVTPIGTASIAVPPRSWALATVTWQSADVPAPDPTPGTFNAIGLVALVSTTEGVQDRAPQAVRVRDAASFWEFFGRTADSNNAAFRAVLYFVAPFTFDPPGGVDDLGNAGSPMYDAWHTKVSGIFDREVAKLDTILGAGKSQLYNPAKTPTTAPAARLTITWKGFPMKFLRDHRDSRVDAWTAADVFTPGVRRNQDEYLEWFVYKNGAGKIRRIDFTAEAFDYWEFLGEQAMADKEGSKLLELYRKFIDPAIPKEDLFNLSGGRYNRLNKWNSELGAMHLTNGSNSLNAEIVLVSDATVLFKKDGKAVSDPLQLINCGQFGEKVRSSDPRIGWDVNNLARLGFAITLENPVGLLIDGLDDTGFLKPDGTKAGNYWKVLRGFSGGIVRATYEVPAAEGFVVGDLLVGGRTVEFGGQIAEHVTMKVVGLACRAGSFSNVPQDCTEPGSPLFGVAPSGLVPDTGPTRLSR